MSYYGRRRTSPGEYLTAVTFIVIVLGFCAYAVTSCAGALHTERVTLEAYAKDRGEDKRVYTNNGDGVYSVNDAWFQGVFDSGTTYAQLPVPFAGAASDPSKVVVLDCKVNGFRVPIFSMFKNILECEPRAVPAPQDAELDSAGG